MAKQLLLPAILCVFAFKAFSQSPLNLSMKIGLLYGKEIVQSKNISTHDRASYSDEPNSNISIAFSLPLKSKLRLGAELGHHSFDTFIDYEFNYQTNSTAVYKGLYKIDQVYIAIVPEYRIFNWAYLNAGAGFYSDYNSYFSDGTRSSGTDITNITGLKYKRQYPFGFFAGAGICPKITKEMAVLAEVRYTRSPASIENADRIGIGYGLLTLMLG